MRAYFISGNKEILEEAKKEFDFDKHGLRPAESDEDFFENDGTVLFTNNGDAVEKCADMGTETFGALLHDKENPVFCQYPCSRAYDVVISMNTHSLEEAMNEVDDEMSNYEFANRVLDLVNAGDVRVRFSKWFFSGGHGEDAHVFDLVANGERVGEIRLEEYEVVTIETSDASPSGKGWFANVNVPGRTNSFIWEVANKAVIDALPRDDEEFAMAAAVNGEIFLPKDNDDISRDEFLSNARSHDREPGM